MGKSLVCDCPPAASSSCHPGSSGPVASPPAALLTFSPVGPGTSSVGPADPPRLTWPLSQACWVQYWGSTSCSQSPCFGRPDLSEDPRTSACRPHPLPASAAVGGLQWFSGLMLKLHLLPSIPACHSGVCVGTAPPPALVHRTRGCKGSQWCQWQGSGSGPHQSPGTASWGHCHPPPVLYRSGGRIKALTSWRQSHAQKDQDVQIQPGMVIPTSIRPCTRILYSLFE